MNTTEPASPSEKGFRLFTYENGLLLLLALTWGFVFFDRQALNFLTPFIKPYFHLSNAQVGLLSSGLAGTWALSAYLIGRWSDARGARKPFLLAFTLIFSTCSFLSGLAPTFLVLLMARMFMGAAEGPFLPVCYAIMNVESSPHRRGFNAGFMQSFFSTLLASVLAPIVLVALANAVGWRSAFYIAGAPGLLCLAAIWFWVREPPKQDPRTVELAGGEHERMGFTQMLSNRNVLLCCLISVCLVTQLIVGTTFLPLFFTSYRHFTPTTMSWVMSIAGIAGPVGFLVPGLSDRFGRKPVIVASSFLTVLAPLSALYFGGPHIVLALLMLVGQLGGGIFPLFMGIVPSESIPRHYAATAMGLVVGAGEIAGGFLAPTLAGVLADTSSLATPILILAGCGLASGLLGLLLTETAPSKLARRAPAPATTA
jgi:ACS family hexuronate transporter-like MFS transporter